MHMGWVRRLSLLPQCIPCIIQVFLSFEEGTGGEKECCPSHHPPIQFFFDLRRVHKVRKKVVPQAPTSCAAFPVSFI